MRSEERTVPAHGSPSVEPYLRGVLRAPRPAPGSRLPADAIRRLPADTGAAARVPAGVHLALAGDAEAVELRVAVGPRTTVPSPGTAPVFVAHSGPDAVEVALPPGSGTVVVPLVGRPRGRPTRIHLPETVEVVVEALSPIGGTLEPAPRGPLWVVYGDSIAQGWSVTRAGRAWPSLVADELALDVVNLGFAGAARGELLAADVVGRSGAAVVTLAWGTNAWSSLPVDAALVAETMRLFLATVRQGLPDAPVVVVSPIVRPAAEDVANRYGTTHAELRRALEDAVHRFVDTTGDRRVELVGGRDLVPVEYLADGLHPDDDGHEALAAALAPTVAAALTTQGPGI